MTRDGGNFWLAIAFRYVTTAILIAPIFLALVLAVINPLWFRNTFFNWVEKLVYKITDANDQERMVKYLSERFHQGALLYPLFMSAREKLYHYELDPKQNAENFEQI